MDSDNNRQLNAQYEKFMILLSENKDKVYLYILSAVGKRHASDDIMQQTLLSMWRTFDRFEEGTNFAAWGKAIAKYELLTYRRKETRELLLDNEALQKILDIYEVIEIQNDDRQMALEGCLKKLDKNWRKLVRMRYQNGHNCQEIAKIIDRPVTSVYKNFSLIHASLEDCIRKTLRLWEAGI